MQPDFDYSAFTSVKPDEGHRADSQLVPFLHQQSLTGWVQPEAITAPNRAPTKWRRSMPMTLHYKFTTEDLIICAHGGVHRDQEELTLCACGRFMCRSVNCACSCPIDDDGEI